jgi:hypothetical protein
MDPLVKIIKVQDVGGINAATLAPDPHTKVTYMVGENGPFDLVTPSRSFTSEYVDTETAKRVSALRSIGAIQ